MFRSRLVWLLTCACLGWGGGWANAADEKMNVLFIVSDG
jgi:hypothetical protein